MPVWLRHFYLKQIEKTKELEKEQMDKAKNKSASTSRGPRVKT